jgi:hypothetical protein
MNVQIPITQGHELHGICAYLCVAISNNMTQKTWGKEEK